MPVDVAVDVGNFREGAVRGIHLVILRGRRDRAQFGHEAPAGHREGLDVVVAAGDDLHPAVGEVQAAELVRGLDRRREPERVVVLPYHVQRVVVEFGREVLQFARAAVVEEQTLLVGLEARLAHRTEGDAQVVGRPYGILVVAGHGSGIDHGSALKAEVAGFADVLRETRRYVVDEDVRIGGQRVVGAREGFAGVGQHRARMVPGDLRHVEIGGQRRVVGRIGAEDVGALGDAVAVEVGHEDVAVPSLVPVVPVAAHQVVIDTCFGVGHILVHVRRLAVADLYPAHVPRLVAAGADAEALDVAVEPRELAQVAALGVHLPHLHRAAAVGEEADRASVGAPGGRVVLRAEVGQLADLAAGHVADVDLRASAVLGEVVARDRVEEFRAVGRERCRAGAAHLPEDFGREKARLDLGGRQCVVDLEGLGLLRACPQTQSCESHQS